MENKFRYEVVEVNVNVIAQSSYSNAYMNSATYVRDIYPTNDAKFVVTETREKGRLYYIKKITNKIKLNSVDYGHYLSQLNDCSIYYVNIYKKCAGKNWTIIHRAFFNQADIDYDLDACTAEVQFRDSSIYNCFNDRRSLETNVMDAIAPPGSPLPQNFKFFVGDPLTYRSISLQDCIYQVIGGVACCDYRVCYIEIISDFFDWQFDAFGNAIPLTAQPSTNYVNPSQPSYWPYIAQKSDFKYPSSSNPATILNMSFDDIEKIMAEVFNVFWIIDGNRLRFEHFSWFNKNVNFDTTFTATNIDMNLFKRKFKIDSDDVPQAEVFEWMEAGTEDFKGLPIEYNEQCSNGKTEKRGYTKATTDINYISNNVATIDNNGIVILDCIKVGAFLYPYVANGQITGVPQSNARMSWANLHYDLHRHNRPFKSGTMNALSTVFLSPVYNKTQDNIQYQLCCENPYRMEDSLVRSELGDGNIEEAEVNYSDEVIKFKLKHDTIT